MAALNLDVIQEIVVGHISQKNNSLDRVQEALRDITSRAKSVRFACQNEGFDWLQLVH